MTYEFLSDPQWAHGGYLAAAEVSREVEGQLDLTILGEGEDRAHVRDYRVSGVPYAHQVRLGPFENITFTDEHPLLWETRHGMTSIRIQNRPSDAAALYGHLVHCLNYLTSHWISPYELFGDVDTVAMLEMGTGLLCDAPPRLAAAFTDILDSHSVRYTVQEVAPEFPEAQLLLLGGSYIIGTNFQALTL